MARTLPLKIAKEDFELPINYATSSEIARRVCDPLQMSVKTQSLGYFPATVDEIIDIIQIGLKHGGYKKTRDWVADEIFDEGVSNFMEWTAAYLSLMIAGSNSPAVEELDDVVGKKKGKSKQVKKD